MVVVIVQFQTGQSIHLIPILGGILSSIQTVPQHKLPGHKAMETEYVKQFLNLACQMNFQGQIDQPNSLDLF